MRLHYSFHYDVKMLVVGNQRASARRMLDTGACDVPEVSDTEAPVAARWRNANPADSYDHVRVFDGRLFKVVAEEHGLNLGRAVDVPAKRYLSEAANPKGRPSAMPRAADIAFHMGDTRAKAAAAAKTKFEGFLIVDGLLYRNCAPPCFTVRFVDTVNPGHAYLAISRNDTMLNSIYLSVEEMLSFGLGQEEDLLEAIEARGLATRQHFSDLEVFHDEALGFDGYTDAAERTVRRAITDNLALVGSWPTEAAIRLLALRDDHNAWSVDPAARDVMDMLDRARDLATTTDLYLTHELHNFLRACDWVMAHPPAIRFEIKHPRVAAVM